jgi:hypothetical protein
MHEAAIHGVKIVRPQRSYRWMDDGVTLDILAPSFPILADTGDDINENSIVAVLGYHGFRELFMGDAGESSEARLVASGADLHADVLKSRSSRLAIRFDTNLHRSGGAAHCDHLRRPPQYIRSSRTIDDRDTATSRRDDVSHRPLRSHIAIHR